MQTLLAIVAALVLIPAAVAGIGSGLLDAMARIDCIAAALPHAEALVAELAPLAPALALLVAGAGTLVVAAWLVVRAVHRC